MITLNLGSGRYPMKDAINIDKAERSSPDILWNLESGLPAEIESDSIDNIYCSHLLEHIDNIIKLMNDCYRVLKPGSKFTIIVPSGHNLVWAMRDPTHKRLIFDQSFMYFCGAWPELLEDYGITCKFILISADRVSGKAEVFTRMTLNEEGSGWVPVLEEFEKEDLYVILQKPV